MVGKNLWRKLMTKQYTREVTVSLPAEYWSLIEKLQANEDLSLDKAIIKLIKLGCDKYNG